MVRVKLILIHLMLVLCLCLQAQTPQVWSLLERPLNFYLANDLGRNGYYEQKPIAELMGKMAETVSIECVVAAGDVHHFQGVRSTQDPLWMTNYEQVYSHPELMLPWYCILGNHEYRGNTQACLDYTKISARWNMPAPYYTLVLTGEDSTTVRLVMLDTPSLIDKYRLDDTTYPDAHKLSRSKQLRWLEKVLSSAKEDWVLVVGHHPIYSDTEKTMDERADMQKYVNSILLRHPCVDMYLCGHIHNFQHIRKPNCNIDYVVNSSASLSRSNVQAIDGTQYCNGEAGFSLITADKQHLSLHMINGKGEVIHTITRNK